MDHEEGTDLSSDEFYRKASDLLMQSICTRQLAKQVWRLMCKLQTLRERLCMTGTFGGPVVQRESQDQIIFGTLGVDISVFKFGGMCKL